MSDQPIVPLNVPYEELSLRDALNTLRKDIFLLLNCHAIGTVTEFTPQDGTTGYAKLSAKINYSKTFLVQQQDGTFTSQQQEYPILVDCPALVLGGGTAALQCPIQPGDQCLILFNDRDLNNWWAGARTGPVASSRLHSFADALALVGFVKWAAGDGGGNHLMLANTQGAQVGIQAKGALCRIANNTGTLNQILGNLISTIQGITTTGGQSVSATSQAALATIASQLSALLE